MAKFYAAHWKNLQDAEKRAVWFDNRPENALVCGDQEEAEKWCLALKKAAIEIPLLKGGKLICRGFQVEELQFMPRQSKRFVVCCQFPKLLSGRAYSEGWISDKQLFGEATKSSRDRMVGSHVND